MNETPQNPLSGINSTGIPTQTPMHESHKGRNVSVVGVAIVILVLVGGWYLTKGTRAVNAAIQTALALSEQGEYDTALKGLFDARALYKNSVTLNFAIAHTLIAEARRPSPPNDDQNREKAAGNIRDMLSSVNGISEPEHASEYHDIMGSTYLLSGDYTNALAHLKESLAADSANISAMVGTGVAFEMMGDVKTAYGFYQKAEETLTVSRISGQSDTHAELFVHLGKMAAIVDNDGSKAIAYFEKAIASAKSYALRADGHYAISVILYQDGRFADSRTHAEEAVLADPDSDVGYIGVLRAILVAPREGDTQKAQAYIWKAIQLNPNRALTRMVHGQIAHAAGNIAQAISSYKDALRIIDTNVDTTLSLGAKTVLRGEIYSYLALAYQEKGNTKDASVAIKSAFEADPIKVVYLMQNAAPFSIFKKTFNIK